MQTIVFCKPPIIRFSGVRSFLGPKQPACQQRLHLPSAVGDQIDDDLAADHAIDQPPTATACPTLQSRLLPADESLAFGTSRSMLTALSFQPALRSWRHGAKALGGLSP